MPTKGAVIRSNQIEQNQPQSLQDMYDPVRRVVSFGSGELPPMTLSPEGVMMFPPPTTRRRRVHMQWIG